MNNLKNNILNKIKSGEVDMKPHWHFVLKSLLLILGIIVAVLLTVYILSFIHFFLSQSGVGFLPLYGFRGVSLFVMDSPWLLVASVGGLIVVLHLLIQKYSFIFRQPLVYSLLAIIILVLFGSYAIEQTQFHSSMRELSQNQRGPVLKSFYKDIDSSRPKNVTFGTITEVTNDGFLLYSDIDEVLKVVLSNTTKQKPGAEYFVDDVVWVFGNRKNNNTIMAIGVRPATVEFEGARRPKVPGTQNR